MQPVATRRAAVLSLLAMALGAAPPVARAQAADAAAPAASAAAAPRLSLSVFVANPEDLLDTNRTLLVPTAYVGLLTDGRVSAAQRSGLFSGGNNTVRASASYKVSGIDKAFAQQLARQALDDFVAQMRAAGFTVLTYAEVREREVFKSAQRESATGPMGLPVLSEGGNNFVVAAPSDEQHFKSSLAGGDFAEFISGGKTRIGDATLVIPRYLFAAPQAWAEGESGYKRISAEANVAEGMNMLQARAYWLGQPKSRMMRGIPGVATRQQVINVTERAGSVSKTADTTPQAANALGGLLSALGGGGNTQRSSGEYLLTVDRDAFAQGVMNGARTFNAEVSKVAAEAKP